MLNDTDLQRRILDRVTIEDRGHTTPCWISNRSGGSTGYTQLGYRGHRYATHRVAYAAYVAPIPDGFQIDHLCRQVACCNPAHLEAVTPSANVRRSRSPAARNAAKTHCRAGHPYDEGNTGRRAARPGSRVCRACGPSRHTEPAP